MVNAGLKREDEVYVSVRLNKTLACDVVSHVISHNEVSTDLFLNEDVDIIATYEGLKAALAAIEWRLQQPTLKRLLNERIAQLKREDEEAEGEPPYPDSLNDIPF